MFGVSLPEIPYTEELAGHWQSLGLARVMPMGGFGGFEWQEIRAYLDTMGCALSPLETMTLMDMSRAYANELSDDNPLSKQPMERDYGLC